MKLLNYSLAICVMILFGSFVSKDVQSGVGVELGSTIPDIQVREGLLKGADFEGGYLLIQFWSTSDAESRIANIRLARTIEAMDESIKLSYVSISRDPLTSVYQDSKRRDGLQTKFQFQAQLEGQGLKGYQLTKGVTNLLVNPQGVIIARNVTPEMVKRKLKVS